MTPEQARQIRDSLERSRVALAQLEESRERWRQAADMTDQDWMVDDGTCDHCQVEEHDRCTAGDEDGCCCVEPMTYQQALAERDEMR